MELFLAGHDVPRDLLLELTGRISASVSIPLSLAVEFPSVEAVRTFLDAGAVRVAVGVPALRDPNFITGLAREHGSDAVAVWVDCLRVDDGWRVVSGPTGEPTEWDAVTWSRVVEAQGGGQLVIASVNEGHDGSFDLELLKAVTSAVGIPVLAVGEPPALEDVFDVLMIGDADGVLLGSLLHSGQHTLESIRAYLTEHGLS